MAHQVDSTFIIQFMAVANALKHCDIILNYRKECFASRHQADAHKTIKTLPRYGNWYATVDKKNLIEFQVPFFRILLFQFNWMWKLYKNESAMLGNMLSLNFEPRQSR